MLYEEYKRKKELKRCCEDAVREIGKRRREIERMLVKCRKGNIGERNS